MKPLDIRKTLKKIVYVLLICSTFMACKKNNEAPNPIISDPPIDSRPKLSDVHLGLGNNKTIIKGRTFYFSAGILAMTKIKKVSVAVRQKKGDLYAGDYSVSNPDFSLYKGLKTAKLYEQMFFSTDVPEGRYDFILTVTDEDESKTELVETVNVMGPNNLPVDPIIDDDILTLNGKVLYQNGKNVEKVLLFKRDDNLRLHAQINKINGDGVLYTALNKRKNSYNPVDADKLDLSKIIIISKVVHTGLPDASSISTFSKGKGNLDGEGIKIGSANDSNEPTSNAVSGDKTWESGQYDLIILYKNTTSNISVLKTIPITIDYQ